MDKKPQDKDQVFHSLNKKSGAFPPGAIILFLFAVLLGIGLGYFLSQRGVGVSSSSSTSTATDSNGIQKGVIYGSSDTNTFKDTTEGVLQKGGIEDEGQFHLVRPGGESQNVYLTSSLVDLSKFVGHKVQVWGQTQAAKHAGWLMDVGRIKELE